MSKKSRKKSEKTRTAELAARHASLVEENKPILLLAARGAFRCARMLEIALRGRGAALRHACDVLDRAAQAVEYYVAAGTPFDPDAAKTTDSAVGLAMSSGVGVREASATFEDAVRALDAVYESVLSESGGPVVLEILHDVSRILRRPPEAEKGLAGNWARVLNTWARLNPGASQIARMPDDADKMGYVYDEEKRAWRRVCSGASVVDIHHGRSFALAK